MEDDVGRNARFGGELSAAVKPTSAHALSRVSGVGTAKLERYGAAFVELIAAWES